MVAASELIAPAPTIKARTSAAGAERLAAPASTPTRDDGPSGAVDAGLGVCALAGAKCMLDELAEGAADAAFLARNLQRRAQLPEDLLLADHHRVEPGGHREQMLHRAVLVVDVEVLGELLDGHAGARRDALGHLLHAAVELGDVGIYLEPVARRHDQRLVDMVGFEQLGEQLHDPVDVLRCALEQRDGRRPM